MLVSLPELLARTHIVSLPLRCEFRGVTRREVALIGGSQVVAGEPVWAEFSPFLEYDVPEAARWLAAALEYGFDPALERFASGSVAVNATVPAVSAAAVADVLARFGPCEAVKVKVAQRGQTLADDLARLEAVRAAAPHAGLRIDANGAWSLGEAVDALRAFAAAGFEFEYVEQPVATIRELRQLRRMLGIPPAGAAPQHATVEQRPASTKLPPERAPGGAPHRLGAMNRATASSSIPGMTAGAGAGAPQQPRSPHPVRASWPSFAADELVRKADDPLAVARSGTVEHLVVKVQPLGGIAAAQRIIASAGLPVTVSGALESSVGIVMGAQLAARVPSAAAGLGTVALFADEVSAPRLPVGGRISLEPVTPDAGELRRLAAAPARQTWWRERIQACYGYLARGA